MRKFLIFLITFLPLIVLSQNYPIQTTLKGKSVVILTTEQYNDFELLLENQRNRVAVYKDEIEQKTKEIDSLREVLNKCNKVIDTLLPITSNYDSLEYKYNIIKTWVLNGSIDNVYLYYSYKDSTIMSINLSSYMLVSHKNGNFSLVRRGPTVEDSMWRNYNMLKQEEPEPQWDLYINEKWRPTVIKFPYKITI
jgi:hypothetical protein